MRNLLAAELLTAWERALGQSPVQQALVLLATMYPEHSPEQLAQISVGRRDACLLTLREQLFGSQLDSVTICPQCQEHIELAFSVSDIRVEPAASEIVDPASEGIKLAMDGYQVHFRLPNSLDLLSIETSTKVDHTREQLLRRCLQSVVCEARNSGESESLNDVSRLPMTLTDTIAERMAQADPQADVRLAVSCPACRHTWHAPFDIASYLMGEIHSWAKHVLREVHSLARAYGWCETDILAMTPTRRRAYLELLDVV